MKTERPRVLFDSCTVLAWVKGEPEMHAVDELMRKFDAGEADLVVSAAIFAEVFKPAAPGENWQPRMDAVLKKLHSRDVLIVDVTEPVASFAAELRLKHGMKGMDSLHLASAVKNGCEWLVTKDRNFPAKAQHVQVWDVGRVSLADLPWRQVPAQGVNEPVQPDLFGSGNIIGFPSRTGAPPPS